MLLKLSGHVWYLMIGDAFTWREDEEDDGADANLYGVILLSLWMSASIDDDACDDDACDDDDDDDGAVDACNALVTVSRNEFSITLCIWNEQLVKSSSFASPISKKSSMFNISSAFFGDSALLVTCPSSHFLYLMASSMNCQSSSSLSSSKEALSDWLILNELVLIYSQIHCFELSLRNRFHSFLSMRKGNTPLNDQW